MMQKNYLGIDLNKDNVRGRNVTLIDELSEIRSYGFTTFDDTTNITDLYLDINSGGLFFAPSDDTDYLEIFDYDGYNFGISVFDGGYIPLAIEQITDSSHEYLGNHILLAFDEHMDRLVGFMVFDENGYYIDDLGSPEDQATINQAEELFGVDLNDDGVQGRNLQEFDTFAYVSSKGITKDLCRFK